MAHHRRTIMVGVLLVLAVATPEAGAAEAPPLLPGGIIAKRFSGPNGFDVYADAQNYVGSIPSQGSVCTTAIRLTTSKTTKTHHGESGCDTKFTDYRFDQTTWIGSATGSVETVKSTGTLKRSGGGWKQVAYAERKSRAIVKLRWRPNGPITYDIGVPNVGICYTLFVVCPSWRAAVRRPVVIEGTIRFEGFSMTTRLPSRHTGTAWVWSS
jgi:hypothetical protein